MPHSEHDDADPPLTHYVLLKRDASGEQMNPCDFFEPTDEKAIAFAPAKPASSTR